jgi:hypothetical protein
LIFFPEPVQFLRNDRGVIAYRPIILIRRKKHVDPDR